MAPDLLDLFVGPRQANGSVSEPSLPLVDGDRQPAGGEDPPFREEVVGAAVGGLALVGLEREAGRFAADRGGDDPRLALQHGARLLMHPPFGGRVTLFKEALAA